MTSQRLQFGMKQSMNLTMGLRQSINLLQMSTAELSEYLNLELDKNPFLQPSEHESNAEDNREGYDYLRVTEESENYDPLLGVSDNKSLLEYVLEQIGSVICDPVERLIAIYLTNLLQDTGYIELDLSVAKSSLKCDEEKILSILYRLQGIEPTGIFARNLQECLTLQLKERNLYDKIFEIVVSNLPMIANHDFEKLSKLCKIDLQKLMSYVKHLKSLNPKPLAGFGRGFVTSIIPDVILSIDDENNIRLRLNNSALPQLQVSKEYYTQVKSNIATANDKEFVAQEYYGASNIMRAISQRSKTILAVASAIAEKQRDFFLKGVMYLKPMTLSDIAADCALNESTISRATSIKYIETPSGIFEMKFFFSSHVAGKNSDIQISSTKVKEIIKSIIESEENDDIFSDDEIVAELAKFNVNIARRTVAKYRESLGIATSSMRKRMVRGRVA